MAKTSKKKQKEPSLNVKNPLAFKAKVKPEVEGEVQDVSVEKVAMIPEECRLNVLNNDLEQEEGREAKKEPNFDLYVGTKFGVLKGLCFGGELPILKNIFRADILKGKCPSVKTLTWSDETEKELLVAFSNQVVKTYNTKLKCFTRQMPVPVKPDDENVGMIGLFGHDPENYIFGLENGILGMWNLIDSKVSLQFKTGNSLSKVRQCTSHKGFYATGGNENDLKIWNISSETPEVPYFKAKNLPHDELDLRQPVWVEDMAFLPRTNEVVAVGTRYGQVRLYDVRAGLRPVSNVKFLDQPIMAISSTMNDREVMVGTSHGVAARFDLRNPGKEKLLLKYVGYTGGIRSIVACPYLPYFVSCGLDRHLYVHNFSKREPVKKLYVKQPLNCIALSKSFNIESHKNDSIDKMLKSESAKGDWANIPSDVLNIVGVPDSIQPLRKTTRKRKLADDS